jgi:hypothetical protein
VGAETMKTATLIYVLQMVYVTLGMVLLAFIFSKTLFTLFILIAILLIGIPSFYGYPLMPRCIPKHQRQIFPALLVTLSVILLRLNSLLDTATLKILATDFQLMIMIWASQALVITFIYCANINRK